VAITADRLARVDAAEQGVRAALRRAGVDSYDLRVRDLGRHAVIQVDRSAVGAVSACAAALEAVRTTGFESVEVDPRGFRSGSLNEIGER
jgi:pyridinium-3,5-biscarboxylic acid mononucleotide sulfurtransferase